MCFFACSLAWANSLDFPESGENGYFQIGTDFNIGLNGAPTDKYFAVDTIDRYGANWRALQIPLENARNYEEHIEPFFTLSFRAGYKWLHVLLEAPLRRDLEAWYQDDLKKNFTYQPSELDINVPNNAFAEFIYPVGFIKVGRFAIDELKISKNDILVGGAPYHDGVHWRFNPGIFRYDFLFSSLNAWLHGDVIDRKTNCPPNSSEAFKQKCTENEDQVANQRNRTYTDNIKTFMFHRFGIETNKFWVYVAEQSMIGGKSPEFRSMSPFMYWHDNYATGYTSAATSFELGYKTSNYAKFYGQINMEDINSPVGESDEFSTSRSIINYLVGYYHEFKTNSFGSFSTRLDVVRTDPVANNSRLPLLKYSSRRNYRSNFRSQSDIDYADAYFVDYPIGYRRGPDALDIWLYFRWFTKVHDISLTFAFLRQGDKELFMDYNVALSSGKNSPSGVEESQYLFDLLYKMQVNSWFSFYLGGGIRKYENLSHEKDENGIDGWLRLGVKFNFNPLDMKF